MSLKRYLGPATGLFLFGVSLVALYRLLQEYHYDAISAELRGLPARQLVLGLVFTGLSYLVMSLYDVLAVRYLGRALYFGRVIFASSISYAFSNTIGVSILTSGSVRYRLYAGWGLSPLEIGKVVGFCALTLWLGIFGASGALLLLEQRALPADLNLPDSRLLGCGLVAVPLAYLALCRWHRGPLNWRNRKVALPSFGLAASQLAVGALDWIMAASVLYVLLPESVGIDYGPVVGIYLIAQMLSLISHVPGGIGVFESLMLLMLPAATAPAFMGAILAYRLIYYLLPLGLAALALSGYEALRQQSRFAGLLKQMAPVVSGMLPQLFAAWALVSGTVLLLSGATPSVVERMQWLEDILPLPLVEISHLLASITGIGLLLLARGLQRRLNAAWLATLGLLVLGIFLSLLKGADYQEALILLVLLIALIPAHGQFYRLSSLLDERYSPEWFIAIAALVLASVWLGIFAYKHVEYSHELWWSFSFGEEGNAPRFLRAQVGILVGITLFAVARLLRPARHATPSPDKEQLSAVEAIIRHWPETYPHLALLADKAVLFDEGRSGFLMYGVEGRSWVAMGDPVGTDAVRRELAWRFRELAEVHDGWTVFYQVRPEHLGLYVDLGLSLLKIGEEARVDLLEFSLEGRPHKGLRGTVHKLEKDGYRFEIVNRESVPALLPQLKHISDAWLAEKNTREKRFSLGFFDPAYLARNPIALVCRDDEPVAFANLWLGAEWEETSVDLMRQLPGTHGGLMDFLFVRLLQWAREQGYRWFNLGMAPLSGLPSHDLAPAWNRFGRLVFGHGEHFYNFRGIRQYKDKFHPHWEPRYLAIPASHQLPVVLMNIAALIAGGVKGIVRK
jgi:phosphatidylglycerol lysyltransferase